MPDNPLTETPYPYEPATGKAEFRQRVLQRSIREGLLDDNQAVVGFVDTQGVNATIESLVAAFPSHFQHTFAAKANAMTRALQLVRSRGMGCEVASDDGELRQALRAGFEPHQVIYDEPAKTRSTLEFAIEHGVNFNIDNFQEFERVRELIGNGIARIQNRLSHQSAGRIRHDRRDEHGDGHVKVRRRTQ